MELHIDPKIFVNWYEEYENALNDPNIRYIFLQGSAGAGKSIVVTQFCLFEMIPSKNSKQYAWVRKEKASIRNSVFQALSQTANNLDLMDFLTFQKSLFIESKNGTGRSIFLGLDDPEKIKSLADLDRIVCEEATALNFDDFTQLDIRLRGRKNQKLICIFNPIDSTNWLKTQIKDNPKWNWTKSVWIEKTVLDNNFVDSQYIESLKNLQYTNPEKYKVYFENKWGSRKKGLIFDNYKVSELDFQPDFGGLDFGYNDPTVLTFCKIQDVFGETKKTLLTKEILYQTGLTSDTLIKKFNDLGVPKNLKIVADSSRPEIIEALKKAGYNIIPSKKGAGSIYVGIMKIKEFDWQIQGENIVKEVQNYCWLEKGGEILDTPAGGLDHGIDSVRYSLETLSKPKHTPLVFW